MAVRRPAVEREHREQGAEAQQQQRERGNLEAVAEPPHFPGQPERVEVEGALPRRISGGVKQHDADQHKGRAHQEVNDELHADKFLRQPLRRSPDQHHDEHGNDKQLIGKQEQEQVPRDERAGDAGNQEQQQDEKFLRPLFRIPRRVNGGNADDAHQKQKRHRDTVHAHRVGNAEVFHPRDFLGELHAANRRVETEKRVNCQTQHENRRRSRHPADGFPVILRYEAERESSHNRRDQNGGKQREPHQKAPPVTERIFTA